MNNFIAKIFLRIFGKHIGLATIFFSMLPIVELRGGIPFGMSKSFWGELALSNWQAFGYSFLGSSLVVFILALIFKPIFNYLKSTRAFKKLAIFIESHLKTKAQKISLDEKNSNETLDGKIPDNGLYKNSNNLSDVNSSEKLENKTIEDKKSQKNFDKKTKNLKSIILKMLGIFVFVAIPIPLTGVWTGTALAIFIGLDYIETILSVVVGNFVAGIIILTICSIFPNFTNIILYIFLALTLILIIFGVIKSIINKKNKKENK